MLQLFIPARIAAGLAGFSTANLESFGAAWAVTVILVLAFVAYAATTYIS